MGAFGFDLSLIFPELLGIFKISLNFHTLAHYNVMRNGYGSNLAQKYKMGGNFQRRFNFFLPPPAPKIVGEGPIEPPLRGAGCFERRPGGAGLRTQFNHPT